MCLILKKQCNPLPLPFSHCRGHSTLGATRKRATVSIGLCCVSSCDMAPKRAAATPHSETPPSVGGDQEATRETSSLVSHPCASVLRQLSPPLFLHSSHRTGTDVREADTLHLFETRRVVDRDGHPLVALVNGRGGSPSSSSKTSPLPPTRDVVAFVGGAIWAIDWTCGAERTHTGEREWFLAVEVRPDAKKHNTLAAMGSATGPGAVQLWRLADNVVMGARGDAGHGRVKKTKTDETQTQTQTRTKSVCDDVTLVAMLTHNASHAQSLRWAPPWHHRRADPMTHTHKNKIGFLAAALADGSVEVWEVVRSPGPTRDANSFYTVLIF